MRTLIPLAVAIAVVAAGCGGSDEDEGGRTSLTIVYWEDSEQSGSSETWTLTCDPPGGSHPDPEESCAALASTGAEAFEPLPEGTVCADIYGGPQRAEVSGTVDGESVDATFERRNGCEIDRWERLAGLLPPA